MRDWKARPRVVRLVQEERSMAIEREELAEFVPHRGKMFIIDRIVDASTSDWTIESETKITPDFVFFDERAGGVPNYVCFEIAAQTISALTGLYTREKGLEPNMGFILSVSDMHFDFDVLKSGQTVRAKAVREAALDTVHSFRATLFVDGTEAGCGKLTVVEVVGDALGR